MLYRLERDLLGEMEVPKKFTKKVQLFLSSKSWKVIFCPNEPTEPCPSEEKKLNKAGRQ